MSVLVGQTSGIARAGDATPRAAVATGLARTDDATTPAGEAVPEPPPVAEEEASTGGESEAASDPDEPAIGEAQSPRNGWWSPRRHRSEPTGEPPR